MREHEIFQRPHAIDLHATVQKPVPESWRDELAGSTTVDLLPLVDAADGGDDRGTPGWCTGRFGRDGPEFETMCGGVNTKQSTHAAIWRQGNLLHFGFASPPSRLNDNGRALLLNCIAYIVDFGGDRPIACTPSGFGGMRVMLRGYLRWQLDDAAMKPAEFAGYFGPPWHDRIAAMQPAEAKAFTREHWQWLRNDDGHIVVDEDAKALDVAIDGEAVAKLTAMLGDAARGPKAASLLRRLVPEGPRDGDAAAWRAWLGRHGDRLFWSEFAGYVFLLDPLAEQRGVPSNSLRGPARANKRG
jgi:hypothetical protein